MRVNVYAEELRDLRDEQGDRVVIRKKKAEGVETFHHYGVRFYLGDRAMHTEDDDDTPAVTFWFGDKYQKSLLVAMLKDALAKVEATETDSDL